MSTPTWKDGNRSVYVYTNALYAKSYMNYIFDGVGSCLGAEQRLNTLNPKTPKPLDPIPPNPKPIPTNDCQVRLA